MFVIAILPTLVTITLKPMTPPGRPFVKGQSLFTSSFGLGGVLLHVVLAVWDCSAIPQMVLAVAVKVSGNGAQGLAGGEWAVKFVKPPGAPVIGTTNPGGLEGGVSTKMMFVSVSL